MHWKAKMYLEFQVLRFTQSVKAKRASVAKGVNEINVRERKKRLADRQKEEALVVAAEE